MSKNIHYSTSHLSDYFMNTRTNWEGFYPSEKWIFNKVAHENNGFGKVLDVGCAIGGLCIALCEKHSLASYTGIDINQQAINIAQSRNDFTTEALFHCDDVVSTSIVPNEAYDSVFALSVADWNVDTYGILKACWDKVKPGGSLVFSQRLTNGDSILDNELSYQYITPSSDHELSDDTSSYEKAAYFVLNVQECLRILGSLKTEPSKITAYGYWGKPSQTARTPLDEIVFSVFSVTKARPDDNKDKIDFECHLPADIFF